MYIDIYSEYIYIYFHTIWIPKFNLYDFSWWSFSDLVFRSQAIIQQESGILEARVVCSEISEAAGDGTPLVLGIEHN